MNVAFLDTGYLLALELSNDQNHRTAQEHWRTACESLPALITTTYVLCEVATFFNSRGYHAKAMEVGNLLLSSPTVELVHVTEALFRTAWSYFEQHQDKSYSLTDCVSFVLMEQRGIRNAFAFDSHFLQAGFQLVPQS